MELTSRHSPIPLSDLLPYTSIQTHSHLHHRPYHTTPHNSSYLHYIPHKRQSPTTYSLKHPPVSNITSCSPAHHSFSFSKLFLVNERGRGADGRFRFYLFHTFYVQDGEGGEGVESQESEDVLVRVKKIERYAIKYMEGKTK